MLISIPPKYSVAEVVGYLKGKSAIAVARQFGGKQKNFNGEKLWARGYAASTLGFNEVEIKKKLHSKSRSVGFARKRGRRKFLSFNNKQH